MFIFAIRQLKDQLEPKTINVIREAVPIDKQVAITLYKLPSCCEYRVVGNAFGVHKSTVKKYFYLVVNAINIKLSCKYIVFPDKTSYCCKCR